MMDKVKTGLSVLCSSIILVTVIVDLVEFVQEFLAKPEATSDLTAGHYIGVGFKLLSAIVLIISYPNIVFFFIRPIVRMVLQGFVSVILFLIGLAVIFCGNKGLAINMIGGIPLVGFGLYLFFTSPQERKKKVPHQVEWFLKEIAKVGSAGDDRVKDL